MKQWLIINTRIWVRQCLLLVIGPDATTVRKVQRVTGNGQRERRNEHANQVRFCSHFFISRSLGSLVPSTRIRTFQKPHLFLPGFVRVKTTSIPFSSTRPERARERERESLSTGRSENLGTRLVQKDPKNQSGERFQKETRKFQHRRLRRQRKRHFKMNQRFFRDFVAFIPIRLLLLVIRCRSRCRCRVSEAPY